MSERLACEACRGPAARRLLVVSVCAAWICLSGMARAEDAGALEEVVVTAQKREQNLIDVPIAVTALKGDYLEQRGIRKLFVAGLATDFCVAWTALDACKAGFETYVIEDACRGIDLNGSLAAAWKTMEKNGVRRIQSSAIEVG